MVVNEAKYLHIFNTLKLSVCVIYIFYFIKILSSFLERGGGKEKEREKHQGVVASPAPPTGDLAHNTGMCPRLGTEPATLWFTGQHSIH